MEKRPKVVLYSSPAHFPFWFASHTWFVVYFKDKTSRYEVLYKINSKNTSLGHIHKNKLKPNQGIRVFSFLKKPKWKGKVIKIYTGNQALKLKEVLEKLPRSYKYKNLYKLKGPNSNTFTSWVLEKADIKIDPLPKNAFGKKYLKS